MRSVIEAIRAFEPNFRGARRALINPLFVALFCALFIAGARAEEDAAPVRAQATGFTDQGYGRLLLTFSEETKAEVQQSNGILVVSFHRPVEVSVDLLKARLSGYVQAGGPGPPTGGGRLFSFRA